MRHTVYHNNKPVALNCEIIYLACTMELSVRLKESDRMSYAYRQFRKTGNKIKSFEDWLLIIQAANAVHAKISVLSR